MRQEKTTPGRLVPLASHAPVITVASSEITAEVLHTPIRPDASADTVDACSEMFKFCKQCDEKYLQTRKIQCLFDVDGGPIHRTALRIVCEVVETLLADIAQSGVCHSGAASLTVTLKRQQGVWILALTERRIAALRQSATVRRLSLVRGRAQLLGAACRVHETSEGFITALMFDCGVVPAGANARGPSTALH